MALTRTSGERLSPRRRIVPGLSRQVLQAESTGILRQPSMGPGGVREVDGQAAFMIACPGLRGEVTGSVEILLIKHFLLLAGTMGGGYLQIHSISLGRLDHCFYIARNRSVDFFPSAQIHQVTARLSGTRRRALLIRGPLRAGVARLS